MSTTKRKHNGEDRANLKRSKSNRHPSKLRQQSQASNHSAKTDWLRYCESGILRPGIVRFGEKLPQQYLDRIDNWLDAGPKVDLVLVIGTERTPFVYDAIERRAEVVCFNISNETLDSDDVGDADWFVNGDVSQTLPHLVGSAFKMRF